MPQVEEVFIFSGYGYSTQLKDMSEFSQVITIGYFKDWKNGPLAAEMMKRAPQAFSQDEP
jgi:hypothetical protein